MVEPRLSSELVGGWRRGRQATPRRQAGSPGHHRGQAVPGHNARGELPAARLAVGGKDWLHEGCGHRDDIFFDWYSHVLCQETAFKIINFDYCM